jgi:hypothetical protein
MSWAAPKSLKDLLNESGIQRIELIHKRANLESTANFSSLGEYSIKWKQIQKICVSRLDDIYFCIFIKVVEFTFGNPSMTRT